ncbi:MAG: peptidoglycan DD-metalloendopeptidase family protein [Pseudomonadales bacterium]|nr:peptidoglycan DD-metalloendopeptidase family protein [Pseudomonadales bacterium]
MYGKPESSDSMKRLKPLRRFRLTFWFFSCLQLPLYATSADLPLEHAAPGGIVIVPINAGNAQTHDAQKDEVEPLVHFYGNRVMVVRSSGTTPGWLAVVGIARSAKPGTHSIDIQWRTPAGLNKKKTSKQPFEVQNKSYPEQHIEIKNKRLVNPEKRDMSRISQEYREMKRAFVHWSPAGKDALKMDWPVRGPISSPFGLTRFFNQQPRLPHSGIDIAATEGTPVKAPKSGRVVATGHYFFNGNTVILDHGQGLVSMFCHLERIDVGVTQVIKRAEQLGTVGQTGRATGPHLHWSLNLNNVRIDPMLFLSDTLQLIEQPTR